MTPETTAISYSMPIILLLHPEGTIYALQDERGTVIGTGIAGNL
jgi:hypothetical protein